MGGVAGICHDMNQDHWGHGQRSPKVIRLVIPTDSTPGPPQVRFLQIAVDSTPWRLDASGIHERPKPGRTARKATGSSISTLFIHPLIAQPALTSLTPGSHPRFAGAAGRAGAGRPCRHLRRGLRERRDRAHAVPFRSGSGRARSLEGIRHHGSRCGRCGGLGAPGVSGLRVVLDSNLLVSALLFEWPTVRELMRVLADLLPWCKTWSTPIASAEQLALNDQFNPMKVLTPAEFHAVVHP